MGEVSVLLSGFVPPLALAPSSNLLLLPPSPLSSPAIPPAFFLLFWSESVCLQPDIQSQHILQLSFIL